MNEINNMSFLTADSKSKMTKVRADVPWTVYRLTPYVKPQLIFKLNPNN